MQPVTMALPKKAPQQCLCLLQELKASNQQQQQAQARRAVPNPKPPQLAAAATSAAPSSALNVTAPTFAPTSAQPTPVLALTQPASTPPTQPPQSLGIPTRPTPAAQDSAGASAIPPMLTAPLEISGLAASAPTAAAVTDAVEQPTAADAVDEPEQMAVDQENSQAPAAGKKLRSHSLPCH